MFDADEFGDARNADGSARLIVVDGEYDGTNDTGGAAFIYEQGSGNLIYDRGSNDPGYTVIAKVDGDDVIASDIQFNQ